MSTIDFTYFLQTPDDCAGVYGTYNSAAAKSRQFEWTACGYSNYATETDIIDGTLDENGLPVPLGGQNFTNRGITINNFTRWFSEIEGLSDRSGTIKLTPKTSENGTFLELNSLNDSLFTLKTEFILTGTGKITLTADDDTWLFINNRLVLDLGGIHDATSKTLEIRENGEIYAGNAKTEADLAFSGVTVENSTSVIKIFHANRDSGTTPIFRLDLADTLTITETTINPDGYVEPLGVTSVTDTSYRQTIMTGIIAESAIAVVLALLTVAIFWARKYSRLSRNRG